MTIRHWLLQLFVTDIYDCSVFCEYSVFWKNPSSKQESSERHEDGSSVSARLSFWNSQRSSLPPNLTHFMAFTSSYPVSNLLISKFKSVNRRLICRVNRWADDMREEPSPLHAKRQSQQLCFIWVHMAAPSPTNQSPSYPGWQRWREWRRRRPTPSFISHILIDQDLTSLKAVNGQGI